MRPSIFGKVWAIVGGFKSTWHINKIKVLTPQEALNRFPEIGKVARATDYDALSLYRIPEGDTVILPGRFEIQVKNWCNTYYIEPKRGDSTTYCITRT